MISLLVRFCINLPSPCVAIAREQLDISQLLSQALHLRDTDRKHRVKVCVLALFYLILSC